MSVKAFRLFITLLLCPNVKTDSKSTIHNSVQKTKVNLLFDLKDMPIFGPDQERFVVVPADLHFGKIPRRAVVVIALKE